LNLPRSPHSHPKRRFRGKRRYFDGVRRAANEFKVELTGENWFDHWHYHADWPGWGNHGERYRRPHLEALATVYRKVASAGKTAERPFQSWISIQQDAGQDAVYIHTPNENGTAFPTELDWVEWGTRDFDDLFLSLIPELTFRVGYARIAGVMTIVAYCPEVGVPLE